MYGTPAQGANWSDQIRYIYFSAEKNENFYQIEEKCRKASFWL